MHTAAFDAADVAARARTLPEGRTFATVQVISQPDAACPAWDELQDAAPASVYQTRRWLMPWIETVGTAIGMAPMLVVARDASGRPVAFLPLGIAKRAGVRTASFLGGRHSNFNMGLFRSGVRWQRADIAALLRAAAREPNARADLFLLYNQPLAWDGIDNPLGLLPRAPSPSFGSFGALGTDSPTSHISSETKRKMRRKVRRLEDKLGPVRTVTASDPATVRAILDAFLAQKAVQLRAGGMSNDFAGPGVMEFLVRAATEGLQDGKPAIDVHGMFAGTSIVATFAAGGHGGRYSGMFNSFEQDPDIARSSPGEQLLTDVVRAKGLQDYVTFDLGVGEARYKENFCDRMQPLFDTIMPITAVGHAAGLVAAATRRAKRTVKQNPWLLSAAYGVLRRKAARDMRQPPPSPE